MAVSELEKKAEQIIKKPRILNRILNGISFKEG